MDDNATPSHWPGVASIAAGTLLLVTSEFLPIGMLSSLAADMRVSEGVAGLSVTAPGFVAAFAAPILMVLAKRLDRRTIILAMTATIIVSNIVAALAPSFAVFLVGRLALGIAVGGLWAFAVAVGRRLVPEEAGARATSVISLGISAGTVFGMPVGALFGDWIGWRAVFGANAVLGIAVAALQVRSLPRLRPQVAIDMNKLIAFARVPMARVGLAVNVFVLAGHFVAYTFLEPYLRDVLRFGQTGVAVLLAGYAAAGIVGSFAGERLAVRNVRLAFVAAAGFLGLGVMAAAWMAGAPAFAVAAVIAWGFAFGAVPVCIQMWMFASSPALYEGGSALMVSTSQIALAAGAAIGGLIVDTLGIAPAFLAAGGLCLGGALIPLLFRAGVAATPAMPAAAQAR